MSDFHLNKLQSPHSTRIEGGSGLTTKGKQVTASKELPLVSIITVVRNGENAVKQTIDSVLNQSYTNIEYIIIDGASTDRTLDIIRKFENHIAYWMSEPDKGIADAWNKGLAISSGSIIGILNAADYFDEKCVEVAVEGLNIEKPEFSYGKTIIVDKTGRQVVFEGSFNPKKLKRGIGFFHPGCFATRKAYEQVGIFNLVYRLAMDCDWIFRCYRSGVKFTRLDNICYMEDGGASKQSHLIAYGEYLQTMKNNNFSNIDIYLSMIVVGLRGLIKSLLTLVGWYGVSRH